MKPTDKLKLEANREPFAEKKVNRSPSKEELSPEQIAIGELLLKEGFHKCDNVFRAFKTTTEEQDDWNSLVIDLDKFSHVKRVHEVHYLVYSQEMKYFSIIVKYDKPKGQAGGGVREWRSIMIPRLISKEQDALEFLIGMFGSVNTVLANSRTNSEAEIVAAYLMGVIDELVCSDGNYRDAQERFNIARDAKLTMQEKGYLIK